MSRPRGPGDAPRGRGGPPEPAEPAAGPPEAPPPLGTWGRLYALVIAALAADIALLALLTARWR